MRPDTDTIFRNIEMYIADLMKINSDYLIMA